MTEQLRPFRADHVGSLLRTEPLKKARQQFSEGTITQEDLKKVEDQEIDKIIEKQLEVGLKSITDGEFRRSYWHFDFLENLTGVEDYEPEIGLTFNGVETKKHDVRVVGKVQYNPDHPHFAHFDYLHKQVNGRAVSKVSIPSPNQLFHPNILNHEIYPDIYEYAKDVSEAYRQSILKFYELGCRYLQIDDVYWAGLAATKQLIKNRERSEEEKAEAIKLAAKVVNDALADLPDDLLITTHICRGNYQSSWAITGGYEPIAKELFTEKLQGFFLEYDDNRSGDFEPLRHFDRNDAYIVLGLFTSKTGELEDKQNILDRLDEATKYVSKDQLCLSPQCGFASTEEGNILSEDEQWRKLSYVIETAKEIYGEL
ncbi:5-methyltetrahydropteroyltriglutamate--homocysteine S-methyltransferase [Mammaliicoccus sciuri]|uniref:5-methyltetrahydropteroyltriglutamate-- homocysteine S-methyltransferase n=1 Tax=Mammaliicoccus sciuri TaxID=1296 RepID=UPI001953853A|nr:5-methyltetrahydropteroyltriglutamate--homocysteine S-methyltransferase [Mammaliicoccus sciuri]MCJ1764643.1 5-methyltetrahydropteroyltriglutamate--homocysteine S-methyltransferase [Mammaliicoccus sciuri]MCJ1773523.1 5-methyltetrahydropteroyltriglutamate--homocysteine S-methyltransferase [Mammaliicoccus sciuri]